jgi:uncharacterized protein with von Willebrand factor type A (vWA) domain
MTGEKKQRAIYQKIFGFIEVLKDADVSISVDEVLSLFQSITEIPLDEKDIFKQTLKTTLIKDYTDIPVFEKCFEEYFTGREKFFDRINLQELAGIDSLLTPEKIREVSEILENFLNSLDDSILTEESENNILRMLLDELENSGSGGGSGLNIFKTSGEIAGSYYSKSQDDETQLSSDESEELLNLIRNMLRLKISKRNVGKELKNREDFLLNKFIYQLTPEEIREMRELINRFGQKLKNRISLRKKRVKRGGLDIKKTFRTNLQYGGVPFRLFFKNKKIDRPQLVVLCDVSRSVNQYSRFMLLLAYTLQSLFSKVRSFAFISNMVEITNLFMEMDPERAINSMFEDSNFTYGWGSNYGRSFDMFMENHSDSLNKKTSVLVLGDARNNDNDPGLESFRKISEKTKNLFWLNPDKKHLWDWNDSIASLYKKYCAEMKEVNNFIDLTEFIDKLFIDI